MLIQLILIQLVTFIVLILVLRLLFYRHLNFALRRLRQLHEEELVKSAKLKEELELAKRERISQIEKGKEEAKALIETARRETELMRAKAGEQAKQDAGKTAGKASQEIERLKTQLLSEMENSALQMATQIIRHTFTEGGREALQHQLINEIIPEIERLGNDQFPAGATRAVIKAPFPLTGSQKERLCSVISQKTGAELMIEEQLSPELIAGLSVEMGALVIDGSLQNKLKKVSHYLKDQKNPQL